MEHLGDYFVEMLDKVSDAAKCSAKGVILTYDIHFLKKKKKWLINELGARVAELRKSDPGMNISGDERIREIFAVLDESEKKYDECLGQRRDRLYPSCCTCQDTQAETHVHEEVHVHEEGHVHEEVHVHEEGHVHEEVHVHDDDHAHEENPEGGSDTAY
jgi:hypothetical protein